MSITEKKRDRDTHKETERERNDGCVTSRSLTHVEAEFADVVPSENARCLLLGVDSHPASAYRQEYTSGSRLVLASAQPIQVSVERRLQQHRLPNVLQLCLLPREPTVVPVLSREHGEHIRLVAHLRTFVPIQLQDRRA